MQPPRTVKALALRRVLNPGGISRELGAFEGTRSTHRLKFWPEKLAFSSEDRGTGQDLPGKWLDRCHNWCCTMGSTGTTTRRSATVYTMDVTSDRSEVKVGLTVKFTRIPAAYEPEIQDTTVGKRLPTRHLTPACESAAVSARPNDSSAFAAF